MSNYQDKEERSEIDEINEQAERSVDASTSEAQPEETEEILPSVRKEKKGFSAVSELLDYTEIFVFAIGFVILLFSFAFRICNVDGDSMNNTLFKGESLVVSNMFYEPQAEDVIVFHQTGTLNKPVVKRIIAVEGETVHLQYFSDSMIVTITDAQGNQRVLEEPYVLYEGVPLYRTTTTLTVPEGKVFVMGDNRNNSMDSRNSAIGMVDTRRILGKVVLRLTPFSRFGGVS